MTILAIGDLHGKDIWQQAVARIDTDHIVFLGDYIKANRWLFNHKIRTNLEALLSFKRRNFSRVHLLLGNQDIVYMCPNLFRASAIRHALARRMSRLYLDHHEYFDAAFQHDQYLFTHAGVSRFWYQRHKLLISQQPGDTIAGKLNAVQRSDDFQILHEKGKARGGPFEHGGITYADKVETEQSPLEGYFQIVGHTKVKRPVASKSDKGCVAYIDCLNSVNEFLYIQQEQVSVIALDGSQRSLGNTPGADR